MEVMGNSECERGDLVEKVPCGASHEARNS